MKTKPFIFIMLLAALIVVTGATKAQSFFKMPKDYSFVPSGQLHSNGQVVEIRAFYMSTCEITNGQYNEFLTDLKKQPDTTNYSIAKVKTDNWKSFQVVNAQEYNSWLDFPVVNISKEAAKLYCEWLSKKLEVEYNGKFTIEARLPTKSEWEWAAYGGLNNVNFPWNELYVRNSKGCYMAHFKVLLQPYGPCKIKLYAPNGYNLYDMAGNVAEMIGDLDIVKGGSWNSLDYELKIEQDMPLNISPTVGFRPIITYIEKK